MIESLGYGVSGGVPAVTAAACSASIGTAAVPARPRAAADVLPPTFKKSRRFQNEFSLSIIFRSSIAHMRTLIAVQHQGAAEAFSLWTEVDGIQGRVQKLESHRSTRFNLKTSS